MNSLALIPTPGFSRLELGGLTIHLYALCILLGIAAAIVLSRYRYSRRGGSPDEINQLAAAAIPAGIIGGRIYHVVTSPDAYFGADGRVIDAFKIWQGGMGIWGAIAGGTFVVWLIHRRSNSDISFSQLADVVAPGLFLAQAIGRWGNWFNGELFGRPTTLQWGLEIPFENRPFALENFQTFHPTFLYESLWCLVGAFILMRTQWIRRLLGEAPGQLFLAYIFIYTTGRIWIEALRVDSSHTIGGVRLNIWVSAFAIVASLTALLRRRGVTSIDSDQNSLA